MSVVADTVREPPYRINASGRRICGAPLRKKPGKYCQITILCDNGRCARLHGGKSLAGAASPQFTTGHKSKYLFLPPMLTARIEELTYDAITNLEESVKTHIALETRINEQFSEGCSLERWREVKGILSAYADHKRLHEMSDSEKPIEPPDPDEYLAKFTELAQQGLQDAHNEELLAERLRVNHETQRKLSESVSKIRKETQETYTQEQWNVFFNAVMGVLVRRIADARLLSDITTDFASLAGTAEPKRIGGTITTPGKN